MHKVPVPLCIYLALRTAELIFLLTYIFLPLFLEVSKKVPIFAVETMNEYGPAGI
jgi:hypothetical protein